VRPDVSIIIPAKNGVAGGIDKCLKGVFSQKTNHSFEVIAIDSGSTDGTLDIVKSFDEVHLIQIKPEEFGHGRTRNLGAREAKGKYIVFLNQDAWPIDDNWLAPLISDLENDGRAAGVYSRHLPKEGCYLCVARNIQRGMPARKKVKKKTGENLRAEDIFFSTVSAAIKKEVFDKVPFKDDILFAEDQMWSSDVLNAGYSIIYEPESKVYHSHNFSFKESYVFARDSQIFWQRLFGAKTHGIFLSAPYFIAHAIYMFCNSTLYIISRNIPIKRKLNEVYIAFWSGCAAMLGEIAGVLKCGFSRSKAK